MDYLGLVMGAVAIVAIGLGHVLVIKWEYYWGARSWPGMAGLGVGMLVASLFSGNAFLGGVLGIVGAILLWGVFELIKQRDRVERGLFPRNPKRKA
jgi:hypothetical protein